MIQLRQRASPTIRLGGLALRLPQKSDTHQTICQIMADVAQDEANDAISMNPNNPRAALHRFDDRLSRLYVGGPITSMT